MKNNYCKVIYIINCKSKIPLVLQYANVPYNFTLNYSHFLFPLDSKQERKWKSTTQELKEKENAGTSIRSAWLMLCQLQISDFKPLKKRNFKDPSNYVQVRCLIRQLNHFTGLYFFSWFRSLLLLPQICLFSVNGVMKIDLSSWAAGWTGF